ncbi:DUF3159 domain-containing protein [Amycolatopsis sp. DSM 110486]|nr:DUF3159 domain-containing protein [Amycolatopsis sp. DSM 110486]
MWSDLGRRPKPAGSASESRPRTAWERTGGLAGLLVSSLPSLVFVVVNSFAGLGYFLSDIWFSLACFVALAVSIVVRRPLVGVVWSLVNSEKMT